MKATRTSAGRRTSREKAEQRLHDWVKSVRWQFAKKYAQKAPHEYTITDWNPEFDTTFKASVRFISRHGQIDLYHGHSFTVYYLNGRKYWTMGEPVAETELVNRPCEDWSTKLNLAWNPPAGFKTQADSPKEE